MSRKDLLAPVLSVLLGVLSAALLRLSAGVPALALGLFGLRRLNALAEQSGAMLRWGRRLAVGGMVFGLVGCLLGVFELASLALLRLNEVGRKTACADNLRRLGQAVKRYSELHRVYPRAVVQRNPRAALVLAPWLAEPFSSRLSWMVDILPFLEETQSKRGQGQFVALAAKFDPERTWDDPVNAAGIDTSVRLFLCNSHPDFDPQHRPALTYYVGISGVGADAVALPSGAREAGFFGYERQLSRKGPEAGESNTLLATETTSNNGPWAAGGQPTVRDLDPATRPYIGRGRPFGGLHLGGANLLMVDGSVRFFTVEGSANLLEQWATLADDAQAEP